MRTLSRWLLLLALLLMATTGRTQKSPRAPAAPKPAKLSSEGQRWVAQTLKSMSLDEKIGQLFAVWAYGSFLSTESQDYKDLLRDVEEKHIGSFAIQTQGSPTGIVRSQVYPTAVLVNTLQSHAKVPLLVAADFERGTSMRVEEGTSFPHAMAVAATGRTEDAYTMGKITALEGKAVGVPWIFAPDADVNSNPDNPIINTRSFGEDPARVSEFVAAFVRGVEENGGLATAKHFPGHGDTSTDSHLDLPTVSSDRAHLDRVELAPFRAAIAAGVGSIMTGHLAVPALEPDPDVPATMSPKIMTDFLRGQMGFDGLVVTDALDMGGVTVRYPPGEVAVRSILAGADVLLVPPVLDAALQAVHEAVASGRIPMARLDEAVTRVLRAKAKLGLNKSKLVDLDALAGNFDRPEFDTRGPGHRRPRHHAAARRSAHSSARLDEALARPARGRFGRRRSVPGGQPRKRNSLARRFTGERSHGHALCARRNRKASSAGHIRRRDCRDFCARRRSQRQHRPARR